MTDAAGRVLVIDDDDSFRFAMKKALRRLGYDVDEAAGGFAALPKLNGSQPPHAALLDLRMGDLDGLDVLRRASGTPARVIVLTGHGTVSAAVEAMKLGAFSFLEKPVDADLLAPLLDQAIADSRGGGDGGTEFAPPIVGVSHAMDSVRAFVEQVGPTDATVAIYGETGTGKEVVARRLHLASPRAVGPFVALNAACVPRDLFESELFGHKKGSFTGATADRLGLFREADGGTLFIDELAELPLESQAKLLRALETRQIRGVGDPREVPVDVRIIAATNRDLWSEAQAGRFREDLYFRLSVFPIVLPPLRNRPDDLAPLADHLLRRMAGPPRVLEEEAKHALRGHDWPGNVRELLNVLRRASLFAKGEVIGAPLIRQMLAASVFAQGRPKELPPSEPPIAWTESGSLRLADVERQHIQRVLDDLDGNITKAASVLGIDRRTLQRKLRSYGIMSDE
ncbi:MAG: sigma-54-dependent Fis family transcriptional regulator [Sandaracinaceae bacterium]|nr:sigma-54-dependent Fis family transcriptional regulator [Sandaracinaceae bacterium]